MNVSENGSKPDLRAGRQLRRHKNVWLLDLHPHVDDRGVLYEVLHDFDLEQYGDGWFGQVYVVHNPAPLTVRAFHRHEKLWDYFCIVAGHAKFVLVNPAGTTAREITLSAARPQLLVVPPGCWHGWMNTTPNTILLSTGSMVYNREAPDEERVDAEHFTESLFDGVSPWAIRPR